MRNSDSFSRRLSVKLIRSTAILFVSAILVISMFTYVLVYLDAIKDTGNLLQQNLEKIENIISDVEVAANSSSWAVVKDMPEDKMSKFTSRLIEIDTNIVSCAIGFDASVRNSSKGYGGPFSHYDKDGKSQSFVMTDSDYKYFGMDWYLKAKSEGKAFWSEPFFDSDCYGRVLSSYCKPLYDENGEFFAVVRCDVDLKWLSAILQSLRPYVNSLTLMASRSGTIISHKNPDMIMKETLLTMASGKDMADVREIALKMMDGKSGHDRYHGPKGAGLIVYRQLSNGWSASIFCTDKDILGTSRKMNAVSFFIGLLVILGFFLSNKKIVEKESRSITALAYTSLSIAQGNFKARIPEVQSKDELRRLHDSLHYLENSIGKYIHELKTTTSSNERYESELNIASNIQMQMLPRDYPSSADVDLYATLHPAKEVGGDLYDFFVKDRMLYFAVGDVSGKGVPAALYMAITRSAFRFIAGLGLPVEGVVSKINNAFCDGNDSAMFVTMFVGRINLDTLELEYCNAGHNPVLIISPEGKPEFLHTKANLAAGLFEDFPYTGEKLQLEKGSRLLVYTDGVTEAENKSYELYGDARLEQFASAEPASKSSKEFIEDLTADVKEFTAGNVQNDDITIMMIKL